REGADGALATGARSLDEDGDRSHAGVHGLAGRFLGSHLSGEGRALTRAFEAFGSSGRPAHDLTVHVGDGHDGIVERRLNVSHARRYVALDLFLLGRCFCHWLSIPSYDF